MTQIGFGTVAATKNVTGKDLGKPEGPKFNIRGNTDTTDTNADPSPSIDTDTTTGTDTGTKFGIKF